jgi:hypothetical protein
MRHIVILFSLFLLSSAVYAQQSYSASTIPKDLLPYASSVVRNEDVNIEVKAIDNVIYHIKKIITVLNKNGDEDAHITIYHNKSYVIRNIKGIVYDEFGKPIKKFSESDFTDQSTFDGFSLFEDTRVKHYLPSITQYPYTIAYEYECKTDQSLNFRDWQPNSSLGTAVENSSFTFICKPDLNIRYKEINIPEKAIISTNTAGSKTYTWKINHLKANKYEPYSPNDEHYLTSVKIAPEKFEYEGIKGSFTNWQELGKWNYDKLLANRQTIPSETIAHVREITSGITDPKLKAKRIYEYMQGKTHYVSVQVGVGSYQPFLASDVDKQNYGDCKALVNYTQALLKAVNIDSYYCVIEADKENKVSMMPDFASMEQGNHIILCLPFKNDTTWLECTDQNAPFGYLGKYTNDRIVLACTPAGGKLMHTPKYSAQQSIQERAASFTLSDKGELTGEMLTNFKGIQYDNREELIDETPLERNQIISKIYPINNLIIKKLDIKQDKGVQPVTTENIKLQARDYSTQDNGKLYFMLNSVNRIGQAPQHVRNRQNNVYINDGFTDEDEITYKLPSGYRNEKIPLNVAIEKPFGKFTATMKVKDGQLIYKRQLQIIDGTYSKDVYPDLVDFYQAVADADHYSVTLIKTVN